MPGADLGVPHIDRRKRHGRAALACVFPRDHLHPRAAFCDDGRNLRLHNFLIARRCHLVLRRQINPELCHFEHAAARVKRWCQPFLVHDAGSSGHPLHITRPDSAVMAFGIMMLDFTLVGHRDRLKAAMRMLANAARLRGWREGFGRAVIQHQEGAQCLCVLLVEKQRIHVESVANPMRRGAVLNVCDFFHD